MHAQDILDAQSVALSQIEIPPSTSALMDVTLSVRGVAKSYQLYRHPQDRLKQALLWRFGRNYAREFWALRNVSFDVRRGETVGVVGRNGSGKSTLLQIIAGTLTPTQGAVDVHGRVAALLELGSGFNPEFTGRENIFLNGAILGLSQAKVLERLDDIISFADIGEFIDQPVKLYSSGMAVRLAFAVQVVVEKDILIVDEALAVGDEAFQRKCMRALEQFRDHGGTVLLVTHNTQTIVRHCARCLFLHGGQLWLDGPSKPVTDIYQRFLHGTPQQQHSILALLRDHHTESPSELFRLISLPPDESGPPPTTATPIPAPRLDNTIPHPTELVYGTGQAEIFEYGLFDAQDIPLNVIVAGQVYRWRYRVRFFERAWNVNFGMKLRTVDGVDVAGVNNVLEGQHYNSVEAGKVVEVNFTFRANLAQGIYYLTSGVLGDTASDSGEGGYLHRRVDLCAIRVIAPDSRTIFGLAYLEPQLRVRII